MTHSACIMCLIGLPGAGKTSFANNLKDYLVEKSFGVFVFEYDNWLIMEESVALRKKRLMALNRVRDAFIELRAAHLNSDLLLILDDNFYYRSMRYEVFRLARELGSCSFAEVLLDTPIESCVARNSSRGDKSIPVETIYRMHQLLQKPNPSKHAWEQFSLVLTESSQDRMKKVVDLIAGASLHPVMPLGLQKSMVPELVSQIHTVDLALRKNVNRILSACSSSNKNRESKRLASVKKELLLAIKCGEITLPQLDSSKDRFSSYCDYFMPYFPHESP